MIADKSVKTQLILAAICFLIAILALIAMQGTLDFNSLLSAKIEWVIFIVGVLSTLTILLWARRRGKLDIFEFPTWISINFYIQGIVSIWLFIRDIQNIYPSLRNNYQYWFLQALALIFVGLSSLWIGYILTFNGLIKKQPKPISYSKNLNLSVTIAIWFVLWLAVTLSVPLNLLGWGGTAIGVWSNYLAFVQVLYLTASAALLIYHFRNPSIFGWVWLILALLSNIICSVAIGSRGAVYYFIYVFIIAYFATGKYKWKWLVAGVITLFVLIPAASWLRGEFPQNTAISANERFSTTYQALMGAIDRPIGDSYSQVVNLYAIRQGGLFQITASVMRQHPAIQPFVGGEMLSEFAIGLVPRVIWPSKPTGVSNLYSISTSYADTPTEYAFSDIGIFADSYRTGGWIVVVVIFLLLGCFLGWLYWRGPFLGDNANIVFYFLLLTIVAYNRSILEIGLFLIQRAILVWLFITFILYRRDRSDQLHQKRYRLEG